MNLLRARVRTTDDGWWELVLLDLDIVADGDSENAMLRDLEHTLVAEYHLAVWAKETPFVRLFRGCPAGVSEAWEDGGKALRHLRLPTEVRQALAGVFRVPHMEFTVKPISAA